MSPNRYICSQVAFSAAPFDPYVAVVYDRFPKGEVEIRRASDVLSGDGHQLGHLDRFLALPKDPGGYLRAMLLQRG